MGDPSTTPSTVTSRRARLRRPTLSVGMGLLVLAWGAGLAARPLNDNSFFTHLATGRLILDRGSVPSVDPYTFTAAGTDWTVQSWLMSVLYAGAERAGGVAGLHVVVLVMCLAAAALVWRLSRPCVSLIPRLALVVVALVAASSSWNERPYMVGVIGLGLVWLALDSVIPPWSMIPIFWLWANGHGSFPLGLALIASVVVGRRLDAESTGPSARVAIFAGLGSILAVIGPLGPKVLLFPLTALSRSEVLSRVVEWKPPTYQSTPERAFLVLAIVALVCLVRRPKWSVALPVVMFVIAASMAQRNIVLALMVLVPAIAEAVPPVGQLRLDARSRVGAVLAVGACVVVGIVSLGAIRAPLGALDQYPQHGLAWLDRPSVDERHRVITSDITGNLLEVLDGPTGAVFVDDRVDMFPVEVIEDAFTLVDGAASWQMVLDRYNASYVVWRGEQPLAALLRSDVEWRVAYSDPEWIVACRRGASCDRLDTGPG